MMDMRLAQKFFSRIGPDTKVQLVGDADQLQSVGAGNVFRELINCGLIPVTVLNEIFRQKKDSLIAYNAQKINNNDTSFFYGNDFTVCKCTNQEEAAEHNFPHSHGMIEAVKKERTPPTGGVCFFRLIILNICRREYHDPNQNDS